MALSVIEGETALLNGTTTVTGFGFAPKAIIFFMADTTPSTPVTASKSFSVGFSDGTNHWAAAWIGVANSTTSSAACYCSATSPVISIPTGLGAPVVATSFTLGSDGFTIVFAGTSSALYYIAFGGTDITCKVGNTTMPTSITTKAVTGLGFQPSMIFMSTANQTTAATLDTTTGGFGVGCAVSTSKRWAFGSNVVSGVTMSTSVKADTVQQSTQCLTSILAGAIAYAADLSSMDVGGFTLNFTSSPATAFLFGYLAISGGQWDCGTSVAPASATTQIVSSMAFQPTGLLVSSGLLTTLNTVTANASSLMGAATGTAARGYASISHNNAIPTTENVLNNTTGIFDDVSVLTNAADFTSFNSNGWTITWAADTIAYQIGWVAMASNLVVNPIDELFYIPPRPWPVEPIVCVW